MQSFRRRQVELLARRLDSDPERLVAIFGPRQTGKTTIVRQTLRQIDLRSHYLALDEPEGHSPRLNLPTDSLDIKQPTVRNTEWLVRQWERARSEANRSMAGFVLVLDEIQRIPDWSSTVKGLWDADRASHCPLHVIILGSAPLLVQAGLKESLAGRFLPLRVTHWSYLEMSQAFGLSLDEYCYFGGYPGAVSLRSDPGLWSDYMKEAIVASAIERDLISMTRIDKSALLIQLLQVGTDYSGQILSYNKMLGHLHGAGNTTTLVRYLDLLSRVGLLTGLPKYSATSHIYRASIPKLNVLNTGLMTSASGYRFEEARSDRSFWGRIVESTVGAHLINTAGSDMRIYYWRQNGAEVDFVIRRGPRVVAVEVKSGSRIRKVSGMEEFRQRYGPQKCLIVGADGIPLERFLSEPAQYWVE